MQDNLKSNLKKIANILNIYVDSNDLKYIEEIEDQFKILFSAEIVKLWKYDDKKETLDLIESGDHESVPLRASLTKQSIVNMSPVISNHSTSDKYYTPEIDNPLELKVKALMIFPILKGKQVLGVLRIWRGIKQKKVFTKKDEITLESFVPLLIKMIKCEKIEKDEMIALISMDKERKASPSTIVSEIQKKDRTTKTDDELTALQKKFDKNVDELKSCKESEVVYKGKLDESQNELKDAKSKYKELENVTLKLSSEGEVYRSEIQKLKSQLETVQKDYVHLKHELKEEKKSNNAKNIKDLRIEKSLHSNKNFEKLDTNMEFILHEVDHSFVQNEYAYILFELMVYALNSKKGIWYLEETFKKSKLVPEIIENYSFNSDIKVNNEKCLIMDFVNGIEDYKKNIFTQMVAFNIDVSKEVPTSLVLDAPKMQSILLHLIMDLHQFVDHTKPVNINFTFKNKLLTIDVGGSVLQKNSLFKSVLKQIKLKGNEKDRYGLQLSLKLMKRLKGKIEPIYEDDYYKFVLTIPTQVIKI